LNGGADGIAHVVQAVEHGDQVVPAAWVGVGSGGLEPDAVGDSSLLSPRPHGRDRVVVVIGAEEARVRERLRQQDRRGAVAATDVGDAGAALEFGDDAVKCGQPGADQVGVVAGPEEALAPVEDVMAVLVPADAGAAAGGVGDPRCVEHRAQGDLEEAGQVGGTVFLGQRKRLLGRQRVAAAGGVVVHVAARGLRVQPFAHVALGGAGARGELGRGERAGAGQCAVQAELVAHHHQRRVQRRADLVDGAEHELLQLLLVEGGWCGRGHVRLRGRGRLGRDDGGGAVGAARRAVGRILMAAVPYHGDPAPYWQPSGCTRAAAYCCGGTFGEHRLRRPPP